MAVQSDGKIVVGGAAGGDFALARYNADGSLDRTFSGDGKQTIDLGAGNDAASDVAIQADGKVVAVGPSGGDFALARLRPDGSLDATFSGDGEQGTDFGGDDEGAAVALQADGRIVAAGTSIRPDSGGYNGDFALARYNPDGSLDTSFANGGKQTTEFNWDETARALAIQADGSIVVAGGQAYPAYPENGGVFALARYTPDGSLEGTQVTLFLDDVMFGAHARAEGVAIQADGKIVTAGWAAGRRRARPLRGRCRLGLGAHERKPAHDLGYCHPRSDADGQLRGLDRQYADQPEISVAALRLGGSQLR